MGFSFSDVGDWIGENAVPILRIATQATALGGIGYVAQLVGYLPPGITQAAANAFIISTPSLIEGKELGAAIITEYMTAAQRALNAFKTSEEQQGKPPPEAAARADQRTDAEITQPFDRATKDPNLQKRLDDAKRFADDPARNVDLGTELRRRGLTPEQLAKEINIRPDVAAMTISLGTGTHLYDAIDWFDAATGQPVTDPIELQRLLGLARHRLASPDVIAELQRRYAEASGLPASVGLPAAGTFGELRTRPVPMIGGNALTAAEASNQYQTARLAFGANHPLANGLRVLYELLVQKEAADMQARAAAYAGMQPSGAETTPWQWIFAANGPLNQAELARNDTGSLPEQILRVIILTAPAWGVGWALGWRLPF